MAVGRPKKPLELTEEERKMLLSWSRRPKSSQRLALRSKIVLACGRGNYEWCCGRAVGDKAGDGWQVAGALSRSPTGGTY